MKFELKFSFGRRSPYPCLRKAESLHDFHSCNPGLVAQNFHCLAFLTISRSHGLTVSRSEDDLPPISYLPFFNYSSMALTIGICAHSYEGAALCFLAACREGISIMGPHMHPPIVMSAVPMALSMPAWEEDDLDGVAVFLAEGVEQVAKAGADFFICPDNTAHLVLEKIISDLPIPGLHIADVV